jgi:hypothetical protein
LILSGGLERFIASASRNLLFSEQLTMNSYNKSAVLSERRLYLKGS